ncbi:MAG: UvrD-helicase domain-containing protein [Bacteroidales bacterium]|jgi:DNA helicase-2/ATP-dependent DNA helicase PcrA|nr:UvrD-helicase domain-containing protein [Bacteroidales bacterium]
MKNLFSDLNSSQKQAVEQQDGPVMVIAGAGSGKTRVLTYRIAHLLQHGVDAFNIMALTFTNKAAREMKERVSTLVGSEAQNVWMGTFHAIFARLLRADGHLLGYPHNFTIYDTDDSKSVLKKIIKDLELDPKTYPPNLVLSRISAAKSRLISSKEYNELPELSEHDRSVGKPEIGKLYTLYQQSLFRSSAMDFDDIIFNFYILITNFSEVLAKYQKRFKYVLIDEFQDTNTAQYQIVKQIAAPDNNICVVGDDAQSIYAFRGANIGNILGFEADYPHLKTFKLEQNYRSTSHIVEASNSVIAKNKHQIHKNLWTDNEDGELVRLFQAVSDGEEASKVASFIFEKKMNQQLKNSEFAILYRTNAQSRSFEEALRRMNIPYIIYGGLSFYQRKEIKDLLAYFRLAVNHNDEEALARIINYPARGIGQTTFEKIQNLAAEHGTSTWQVLHNTDGLRTLKISINTINRIDEFVTMITNFGHKVSKTDAHSLAKEISVKSGIIRNITEDSTPEGVARLQNIEELINAIGDFTEKRNAMTAVENLGEINPEELITLDMFMQDVALLTDKDTQDDDDNNKVQLMTIHAAKGLEFSHVFVVGMEENLFPGAQSIYSREDLEEERRLLYVACTRAQKSLTLSYAENRYRWGSLMSSEPSRFLKDFDYSHFHTPERSANKFGVLSNIHGFDEEKPVFRPSNTVNTKNLKPIDNNKIVTPSNQPPLDYNTIQINDRVIHSKFGEGVVISLEGNGPNKKAKVNFKHFGEKLLLLHFAKLQKLN